MTRDQIDALWHRAMRDAIAEGEQMTRYRFAALVAAAEREACAKVCEKYVLACNFWHPNAHPGRWFADAIRARGTP